MGYSIAMVGIFIFIFGFFTFNQSFLGLLKQSFDPKGEQIVKKQEAPVFCENPKSSEALTFQAPADNAVKSGGSTADEDELLGTVTVNGECGGTKIRHVMSPSLTTYKLIKKNVPMSKLSSADKKGSTSENFIDESCHFDTAEKLGIDIPEIDKTKFKIFFPEISGEIDIHREIPSRTRNRDSNLLYFIDYGLVFLLHLDDKGEFVKYLGKDTNKQSKEFYLADIYQDSTSNRPTLPIDAFTCNPNDAKTGVVFEPYQEKSKDQSQLQEQYFNFNVSTEVINGWGVHCKPAIYLYPPQKQMVNVKVYPNGFLTYVDPPYDADKGWTVWAEPGGKLSALSSQPSAISQTFDYLYFESKIRDEVIQKPTKGWVVKFDELEDLYKDILPKLGLNQNQTADFIEYWNKALPPSPYYFVGVINQNNVNEIERLEITPKPDSVNRVRIYFERLDSPKTVEAPDVSRITYHVSPDSFAVTEWGGMVKNDPNHPFTCSQ